jgi:hypothetical protein
MLRATQETAEWTLAKIDAVRKLIEHTAEHARKAVRKQYSRELIDLIFMQPYCRIENVVGAGIAKRHKENNSKFRDFRASHNGAIWDAH